MDVLVVDVGGSHIKFVVSERPPERFESGETLTPASLVAQIHNMTPGWAYDVVSLGYPGRVGADGPVKDPGNLGAGWVGFDFEAAFGKPVRVVNDAVMQALGAYDGGRMLFLGLGTGVGSALVSEHVVVPLELGDLRWGDCRLVELLGREGREKYGHAQWVEVLRDVSGMLLGTFVADYIVLGGGNAAQVDPLPRATRRGGNEDALKGGVRLWEEIVEPHDRQASRAWRLVR